MASKKAQIRKGQMSFSFTQVLVFAVLFAVVGTYALMQSFAAPGGKGKHGTSSPNGLTLAMVTDVNSDGLPNYNDTVTFNLTQTVTSEPHVDLACTQNGAVVYSATTGLYASYPWPWTKNMKLSSNSWTGGSADCTAKWYYFDGRKTPEGGRLYFTANA